MFQPAPAEARAAISARIPRPPGWAAAGLSGPRIDQLRFRQLKVRGLVGAFIGLAIGFAVVRVAALNAVR